MISDKILLITGGTGSFGSAVLNRFLFTNHFKEIRVFSRDEKKQDDMRNLYKNDKIRLESIEVKDLKESVKILQKAFGNKPFDIIYYHLDDYIVQGYDQATIKSISEN